MQWVVHDENIFLTELQLIADRNKSKVTPQSSIEGFATLSLAIPTADHIAPCATKHWLTRFETSLTSAGEVTKMNVLFAILERRAALDRITS
jgi:hypothetical protein